MSLVASEFEKQPDPAIYSFIKHQVSEEAGKADVSSKDSQSTSPNASAVISRAKLSVSLA